MQELDIKVTIITVSYNSESTISDTIESVLNQDYSNFEYIIIDGASTDDTLSIVKKYQFKFQNKNIPFRFYSEPDNGIYDAMNKGVTKAQGDWIGILNSDDCYINNKVLSSIVSNIIDNPSAKVHYADLIYVKQNNVDKITRYWKSGKFDPRRFYYGWVPPHPTLFIDREVYDSYGLYNENLDISADYEFMLRIFVKNNVPAAYLPKVLIKMRDGGASNISLANRKKGANNIRIAWKINQLNPLPFTFILRLLRKIPQYIWK